MRGAPKIVVRLSTGLIWALERAIASRFARRGEAVQNFRAPGYFRTPC
jgi:hypothetical protein